MHEEQTTRRDVLKAAGVLGLGASLAGCNGEDHYLPHKPAVPGSAGWLRGEERYVATACGQCEAGCGVLLRVVEGRAVKVEGNRDCPVNRGGVGPRGLSAPQVLYDPDRITGPMIAEGGRGSGKWKPISWEEALEMLATRLADLREGAGPERLGILSGRERGMVRDLWARFAESYGTPNLFDGGRTDDGAGIAALQAMQGIPEVPAYDWEHTRFVLSLGSGVLDASCQVLHFARIRGNERDSGGRTRIVHVGPALSRTAMNADEWISANPGTHAAFALGVAHVLVRDGLHDQAFVDEHTLGFEPWTDPAGGEHIGFRTVLEEYTPERVAEICGVPADKLETVAHKMAAERPCFALSGPDELKASNGVQTAMAVHALNALLGSIDRRGGVLVQENPPLADWKEFELDEVAEEGLSRAPLFGDEAGLPRRSLDHLPAALARDPEQALDTLLIDHANPVYSRANPAEWRAALAAIPFTVSFSPFMDETTTECVDLVLPDDSWLERWGDSGAAPALGRSVFGLRQPVVERLHDTRSTADVLIDVAKAIGDGPADALSWKDFNAAFKKRVIGLYKAKSGSIVEAKGSTFLKRLYAEGFWAGDEYVHEQWERVLRTESGRFEFFSNSLRKQFEQEATNRGVTLAELSRSLIGVDEPDRLCLPDHRDAIHGDPAAFPLILVPYKPHTYARGSGANLPWLAELAPWRGRSSWITEAELHPDTADEFGIRQGDSVTLESSAGSAVMRAYVNSGVRPGCVRAALGAGHTAFGRFAKGWGANAMHLVSTEVLDPHGGSASLQGTRVAIRRNES